MVLTVTEDNNDVSSTERRPTHTEEENILTIQVPNTPHSVQCSVGTFGLHHLHLQIIQSQHTSQILTDNPERVLHIPSDEIQWEDYKNIDHLCLYFAK